LKARQKGMTTFLDAYQLIMCLMAPINAVVISHEKESTIRLFRKVKNMLETFSGGGKATTEIDRANEITFPKTGSHYYIGTAGQKAFGRGDTIDMAHLSEAAFYDDLKNLLGGIAEAAEFGQIDLESTPNGGTHFKELWQRSVAGMSPYTPIFIPWFIDEEYSADNLDDNFINGLSKGVRDIFYTKDSIIRSSLTEEEKELIFKVQKEYCKELTMGQIKWRRYKIWDKADLFWQEYPEDDVSCFLRAGRSVFTKIDYKLSVRKEMKKGVSYYAGLDGAEGIEGGDNHSFAVIDTRTDEKEGLQPHICFEMTSNEPMNIFLEKVAKICLEYDIMLGVEKNGIGLAHSNKLKDLGVPHHEWITSGASRPVMITELEEAYRKGELTETYKEAYEEALGMYYDDKNRATHPTGKHDDRVFARAIAWQMLKIPEPRFTLI